MDMHFTKKITLFVFLIILFGFFTEQNLFAKAAKKTKVVEEVSNAGESSIPNEGVSEIQSSDSGIDLQNMTKAERKAAKKIEALNAKNEKKEQDRLKKEEQNQEKKRLAEEKKQDKKKKRQQSGKIVELINNEGAFRSKNVDTIIGNFRIFIKGSIGSYQLYAIDRNELKRPLLAGYDEFTSSFFAVKIGKRVYRLSDNIGVVIGTRYTDVGAQVVYVIPKLARLLVKFDCYSSRENENQDIIKVTAVLKNRSKRTDIFALKSVLDTYLGEQKGPHFSTADSPAINCEMQFRKFDRIKWIQSENSKTSMQILLSGADITPFDSVTLASKDLLATSVWSPNVVESRTFDSVLTYNNSAVSLNWEDKRLGPDEEMTLVYYIAIATEGEKPNGQEFIENLTNKQKKQFEPVEKKSVEDNGMTDFEKAADESKKNAPAYSEVSMKTPKIKPVETPVIPELNPMEDYEVISADKLNYEYIQELLDKINSLESSDENIDKEELIRLNNELDNILSKLRQ